MFRSSIQKYNLCYQWYIGDGDSSSFSEVVNAKPYGDTVVIKEEHALGMCKREWEDDVEVPLFHGW